MWELEKTGNSELLSQALKKQEEKSENGHHRPARQFLTRPPQQSSPVFFPAEAD